MIVSKSLFLSIKRVVELMLSASITKILYTVALITCSTKVLAVEGSASQITSSDPMSSSYLVQLILGLVVVVLCIIALAWFAKKMNRFQAMNDDSLKIIAGISMGTRERAVLLQVGEEQLLVGVTPGRLQTLHVLEKPIEIIANNTASQVGKNFSDKLKMMMADATETSPSKKNKQ